MKWPQSEALKIIAESLNARLVTDWRMRIRSAGKGFSGILTPLAMDVVEALRLQIVRLEVVIRNRPGRRDASEMPNFAKIFTAEAEKRGAALTLLALIHCAWGKRRE